jgi:hypothetical protein
MTNICCTEYNRIKGAARNPSQYKKHTTCGRTEQTRPTATQLVPVNPPRWNLPRYTTAMSKIVDDSLPSTEPGTPNPELAETDRELANDDPEKAAPAASLAASVPSPPPDGGLQAWLAVLGGFCMVFASFGWINCTYYSQRLYVDGLKLIPHQALVSSKTTTRLINSQLTPQVP